MELYYIIAVTDADRGEVMNALFREAGLPMILSMPGRGTAKNEHLAVYGLGETPKTVTCAVAGAQQAAQQPAPAAAAPAAPAGAWTCPQCGNTDQSKMNVARRTCGYIGTQYWNQGRTQEIRDRVLHL